MTQEDLTRRLARVQAAIRCEKGDRVPVIMALDYKFSCRYKGITQGEYFRNRTLGTQAMMAVFDEIGGWDVAAGGGMTTGTRDMLEAPMVIKVPGKDIGEDEVIQRPLHDPVYHGYPSYPRQGGGCDGGDDR